ncbi:MAG: MarR family winged helix-turn-helix transcriptional regulator [Actinomycetales bacterium]
MAPERVDERDEVDRIVGAWQRERPDLDVSPLQVLSRVSRLARHLDLARRAAFAEHGLETWEFDVLSALRRAGAPYQLSPGRLVTQTLVTSGTMTNRIDRLEQRGLLARSPDPSDRRGVLVRLTAAGQAQVDAAMADLLERERALLEHLDDRARERLAAALRTLVSPFDSGGSAGSGTAAGAGSGRDETTVP